MNKKTFLIIMSIALVGGFFLPYFKESASSLSGFDIVFKSGPLTKGPFVRFVFLLLPLSGLLLLIDAEEKGSHKKNILDWLPILTIAFIVLKYFFADKQQFSVNNVISYSLKGTSFGWWITFAAALLLVIVQPRPNQ